MFIPVNMCDSIVVMGERPNHFFREVKHFYIYTVVDLDLDLKLSTDLPSADIIGPKSSEREFILLVSEMLTNINHHQKRESIFSLKKIPSDFDLPNRRKFQATFFRLGLFLSWLVGK